MVIGLALILTTGGVLVLRPLAKRLGAYLDVLVEERRVQRGQAPPESERLINTLENIERRLARLEERQSFTDQLLSKGERARLERGDEQ